MSGNFTSTRLRDALLETLTRQVEDGTTVLTKQGETVVVDPTPQVITAAVGFLKTFPPDDIPLAQQVRLSEDLAKFGTMMPFRGKQ